MTESGILDLSPVQPPSVKAEARGRPCDFWQIIKDAEMPSVVSTNSPPDIRIHSGSADFKVPSPGKVVFCLAGPSLPTGKRERAREILRRLAYGFHDWAARETVARYHRDIKRRKSELRKDARKNRANFPAAVRIWGHLSDFPGASVTEIAEATGVAQSNVSRMISSWVEQDLVHTERLGKSLRCYLTENAPGGRHSP